MSHVHVCLVSEQTVPNILGIFHFKPEKVVFCTTKRMEDEQRTDSIINTLKLYGLDYSKKHERIVVDQDCLEDCESKFEKVTSKYRNNRLIVNLTGGTKIMVLGAYNAFKDIAEQMIYTPIPKNEYLIVHPRQAECRSPVSLNLRLSVEAYVTAYGIKVDNRNNIEQLKSNAKIKKEICRWMAEHYLEIEDILIELYDKLKDHRDDRHLTLKFNYPVKKQAEMDFLKMLNFQKGSIDMKLSKQEIRFLTGDWLSDFCFNELLDLSVDDCVTGIELISPKGAKNEFDVMFTKDNALYIVECKSLRQRHDKEADILYKISALQHEFGLKVKGFLVSTARNIISDVGNIKESIIKRADQCKTQVIHPDEIKDFSSWIKTYIKGL